MNQALAVSTTLLLGIALVPPALSDTLSVGDPAPKLTVSKFVQGEPVGEFARGKVYVVEFWATWCGPCRVSIPHLSELQKAHPEVAVIGVSFLETDPADVAPFVREMGEKMSYRVAIDSVAEGQGSEEGAMARTWMDAAGEEVIPRAFLVDGDGKIAWIGDPMELDRPLREILAGTWDRNAERVRRDRERTGAARLTDALDAIEKARPTGQPAFLAAITAAETEGVTLPPVLVVEKIRALAASDRAKALLYGEERIAGPYKDDAIALHEIAWSLVAPLDETPDPALVRFGLKAAFRADSVAEGKDAAIADTLARAYFESGDLPKAIATQERAVKLGDAIEGADVSELRENLERYREAAKK